jgi:hypothetical protein
MIRLVLAVVVGTLVAATLFLTPPRSLELGSPLGIDDSVRGAFHVHTRLSDGGGAVEDVAAAASRAGLRFVILTDHGDGVRMPESPVYRDGVLCIEGVEVSTDDGHLVGLGMGQSPYPLGGEGRDAVADVVRLGGFAIAAHPTAPGRGVRWRDWTAPFGGIEWLSVNNEWRNESYGTLVRTLLTYPVRPSETLGGLLDRSESTMARWDALTARRRVVGLAGADAHAFLGLPATDDPPRRRSIGLPLPSYETVFNTASITVSGVVLTGSAEEDARAVIEALRRGHVHSTIDAMVRGGGLIFTASSGRYTASAGDALALDGEIHLKAAVAGAPPGTRVVLFRDGKRIATREETSFIEMLPPEPAVYRVEVELPEELGHRVVPWLVSNPIYVGKDEPKPRRSPPVASTSRLGRDTSAWMVEHSSESEGAIDIGPAPDGEPQGTLRFALSGPISSSQFAAMAVPTTTGLAERDRLSFRALASRPMRVSVQLRVPGDGTDDGTDGMRWRRSVYLDSTARDVSLFFNDFRPVNLDDPAHPPLDLVRSILFMADTVNARTGTNGRIVISGLTAQGAAPGGASTQVRTVRTR